MKKAYFFMSLFLLLTVLPALARGQESVEDSATLAYLEAEELEMTVGAGDTITWEFEETNDAVEIWVLYLEEGDDFDDIESEDDAEDFEQSSGETSDDGTITVEEAGEAVLVFWHFDAAEAATEAEVDYTVTITKAIPGYDVSIVLLSMGLMTLGLIFIIMKKRR